MYMFVILSPLGKHTFFFLLYNIANKNTNTVVELTSFPGMKALGTRSQNKETNQKGHSFDVRRSRRHIPAYTPFSYPEPILRAVNGRRRGALAKSISNWHLIGYNEGYCSNNVYIFYHVFMVSGFGFGQIKLASDWLQRRLLF